MNTPVGIILLIAGLILGPIYYTYVRFFTGDIVASQTISHYQKEGKLFFDPVLMQLTPDMNAIGLIIRFDAAHGPLILSSNAPRNNYHAIVSDSTHVLVDKHFSITSPSVDSTPLVSFNESLPLFQVEQAGEYHLKIAQEGEAEMNILSTDVQIRAKMNAPDMNLVTAGIALLVAGILAIVF